MHPCQLRRAHGAAGAPVSRRPCLMIRSLEDSLAHASTLGVFCAARSGAFGRPSTRSPSRSRCTRSTPPTRDTAGDESTSDVTGTTVVVVVQHGVRLPSQPRRRPRRAGRSPPPTAWRCSPRRARRRAPGRQPGHLGRNVQAGEAVPHHATGAGRRSSGHRLGRRRRRARVGRGRPCATTSPAGRSRSPPNDPARPGRRSVRPDRRALGGQRRVDDAPAVADVAEHGGRPGAAQPHVVRQRAPRHLAHRTHLDGIGLAHVQHEARQATMAGAVRVAAGEDERPIGDVGAGRPGLAAVEPPPVTVTGRGGRQVGEVRAGARLAEQQAPRQLARHGRAQHVVDVVVREVRGERRRDDGDPRAPRARPARRCSAIRVAIDVASSGDASRP